jgi:hypothetical protein
MTITWEPARRDGFGLFIALAGGSRSGKTFSALELATGIAGPRGKIAAVDTESKRMSHYSSQFTFHRASMDPPFSPDRFAEHALSAETAGFSVLVIDSFSLEWAGEGGVLDWHERELQKMVPSGNETERKKKSRTAWIKPKAAHKAMMNSLLQRKIPIIFCLRAEEKFDEFFRPLGWVPQQDKRFIFEWTVSLTLSPARPGEPDYDLPHKLQDQHRPLFPEGQKLTAAAGAALWAWACGDLPAPPAREPEDGEEKVRQMHANAGDRAVLFVAELKDAIAKAGTRPALNALLDQKAVRARLDRLVEAHPDKHREVMEAVQIRTADLAANEMTQEEDVPA